MDEKKTTQALKQIFDQCGAGILKERNRFEAYLEDLLPGSDYISERRLLRHALDSDALTFLLRQPAFTETTAMQAVGMLQKDIYVGEDAARFVVRCVIIAQGGVPRLADKSAVSPSEPTPPKPAPAPSNPASAPPPQPSNPAPMAQAVPCGMVVMPTNPKLKDRRAAVRDQQQGEVQMLSDKLVFTSAASLGRTEIPYRDITEVNMFTESHIVKRLWKFYGSQILLASFTFLAFLAVYVMGSLSMPMLIAVEGCCIVTIVTMVTAWHNNMKVAGAVIHVKVDRLLYSFFKIKDEPRCMDMYTALRQRIYQNP